MASTCPYALRPSIQWMLKALLSIGSLAFTALICYPVSALLGPLPFVTRIKALRQIDESGQAGLTLAWIGIWTGALTILGVLCASTLTALFLPRILDYLRQAWSQMLKFLDENLKHGVSSRNVTPLAYVAPFNWKYYALLAYEHAFGTASHTH